MRARAQKKKKVADEAEENRPRPESVAAGQAAEVAARRALPDPQGTPVVAPVLMPAVVLADREAAPSAPSLGVEAEGVSIAPVVEAIMSVTASPRPSTAQPGDDAPSAQESDAQTSERQRDARPSVAPSPRAERAADEDAPWHAPDEARLLVQSPRRLFLYWRFARDPRELLREALGSVAERFSPAVRLVDVASGEEGESAPAEGGDYWFDVLPGRLLRADVGFHGEGLPFVRLISSNTVETPAVGVSPVEDESPQFRVAEPEFERVLEATGFAAEERQDDPARRNAPDRRGETSRPSATAQPDAPERTGDPPRPRASSDTARPVSSPRDGGHFSNPRGGELF